MTYLFSFFTAQKSPQKPVPTMMFNKGFRTCALRLAALAMAVAISSTAIAQENEPFTIEADDFLEWNQNDGTYSASGNAIAQQSDQIIKGQKLVASYDPNGTDRDINLIVATGDVEYSDSTSTAKGAKLTYDLAKEVYLIEGKGAVVEGPNGSMRADKTIELLANDPEKQIITAVGAAQYTDAEGQIVEGETIIARLDADGALDVLDATQRVKVVSTDGKIATGDAVTYSNKTSKALLTGNVEIIDNGSILRGSRAEVDFDTGISRILSDGSGKRVSGTLQP